MSFIEQIINNWIILVPIIISVVSLIVSFITFWFSEIRGPDLVLLNPPEQIQPDYVHFKDSSVQYFIPTWFSLEPIQLLFANHGGKAGTILKWNFKFEPTEQFQNFSINLCVQQIAPITIDKGNNMHLDLNLKLDIPDWKYAALAKLLNIENQRKVEELVTIAIAQSETDYESFCDFMELPGELGKLSIEVTITSGRFREGVKDKIIVKDMPIQKKTDETVSFIRKCLNRWEFRQPNKNQLLLDLRGPIKGIHEELENNLLSILSTEIEEHNFHKNPTLTKSDWRHGSN